MLFLVPLLSESHLLCRLICIYKRKTKSTMPKKDVYVGKRFGLVQVLSEAGYGSCKRMQLNCLCDCGKEFIAYTRYFQRGKDNCGCLTPARCSNNSRKEKGVSTKNALYHSYKSNAKRKNYEFSLSIEEVEKLFQSNCHYCGSEPNTICDRAELYGTYTYNGIDRKNSDKGYTTDNVVACCQICNFIKASYSYDVFLGKIKAIYQHSVKTGLL